MDVRRTILALLLIGLAVISPAYAQQALDIPTAVIISRSSQPESDENFVAYTRVFDSVSIAWKMGQPDTALSWPPGISPNSIVVLPAATARSLTRAQVSRIAHVIEAGATVITEGVNPLSTALGIRAGRPIAVREVEELAYPQLRITWAHATTVVALGLPPSAIVLTRERGSGRPVAALVSRGSGHCLVLASELDLEKGDGFARYPFLVQQLIRAGVKLRFRSDRLAAIFDQGYRFGASLDALADYWSSAGIASLQVGAWYYFDDDARSRDYLRKLISACHRHGILVYAWLELPHVSAGFWNAHPGWREKTATRRDAQVDWRSLMNLADPDCFAAVMHRLRDVLQQFDWDGVNLSELYFEGPLGPAKPSNFTPMNDLVRADFKARAGIDPVDFFTESSPHNWKVDTAGWKRFVEYRVELETTLNERVLQWLCEFRRTSRPSLGIILLYVDSIADPSMREGIGADVRGMFDLLEKYEFTLVLEDPATVWSHGPRRYAELADSYSGMTTNTPRLGIDINIVDRTDQVVPTARQTGSEFLQLFHEAGSHFPLVMAYSEESFHAHDAQLIPYALAPSVAAVASSAGTTVKSDAPVVCDVGNASREVLVDGKSWPFRSRNGVMLPAGTHNISFTTPGRARPHVMRPRVTKLNGTLLDARYASDRSIEFTYQSGTRAIAVFDRVPTSVLVDGAATSSQADWRMLPSGTHRVVANFSR